MVKEQPQAVSSKAEAGDEPAFFMDAQTMRHRKARGMRKTEAGSFGRYAGPMLFEFDGPVS
ncbi:MAG TPA: hypothetical protein VLH60_01770, partial [Sedimentisphaerales bacterium]|nr:hypothetical protein [Sedimentisphaerales bacterium]